MCLTTASTFELGVVGESLKIDKSCHQENMELKIKTTTSSFELVTVI
jgi:hypothetical protein